MCPTTTAHKSSLMASNFLTLGLSSKATKQQIIEQSRQEICECGKRMCFMVGSEGVKISCFTNWKEIKHENRGRDECAL